MFSIQKFLRRKTLLLILFVYANSCSSQKQKNKNNSEIVFKNYLNEISNDSEISSLKNNLKDSIQFWVDKGLYYILFFRKAAWKIDDAVFLNKQKDKALFIIPLQPNDKQWPSDYAKIIGGEKINGVWRFYYASYPLSVYERVDSQPMSLDTISKNARMELINDGFIVCKLSCKINYGYVESDVWFKDWMREMHLKFLNNTLKIHPLEKPGESPY